ncbi:MAG TPA: hypothetical protein VEB66_14450, partial [Opitutaceae bacterium]|nr:hypothetical protein [Opitutaceae bacterium]
MPVGTPLILSIESRAVVLSRPDGRGGEIDREPCIDRDDAAADDAWAAAFSALARRAQRGARVGLLVPAHRVLARHLPAPATAGAARDRAIAFEAGRVLPVPLEDLVWDHVEAGGASDVLVLAARAARIESLCAAAESAGFSVTAAWPAPLATLAALRADPGPPGRAVLAVVPGDRVHEIVLLDGERIALRVAAAEPASDPAARATQVVAEAARTLRHFRASAPPAEIRLAGIADPDFPSWRAAWEARLGAPVRSVHPGEEGAAAMRRAGAALLAGGPAARRADLLPPARR